MRSFADAFEKMHDPLFDGVAFVVSRVGDQILRADGHGANQFASKRLDRQLASFFVRRRQVNQVVVVDHERIQVVLLAGLVQQPDGGQARRGRLPLAWTRREYLKCVGAKLRCFERGPFQSARD